MRKALNIERILCDMRDLAVSVANGNEKIKSAYFDKDDDLIIVTEDKDGSYDWTIGFSEEQENEIGDDERKNLIELAANLYMKEADDDVADYSVHDALFDAATELGIDEMLNDDGEGYYDCLIEDLKYVLGID